MQPSRNPLSADRIVDFIRERGESGVTLSELVWEFLRPASAPSALCERILRPVLEQEERLQELPGNRWALKRNDAPPPEGYAVIEALALDSARRGEEIEVCAVRLTPTGEPLDRLSLVVRQERAPSPAEIPARLRARMQDALDFSTVVERLADFAEGATLVAFAPGRLLNETAGALIRRGGVAPVLELRRLARSVFGKDAARSREGLAAALGLAALEIGSAEDAARASVEALSALIDQSEGVGLLEQQHPLRREADFDRFDFTREDLARLPETPGVYLMKDANGVVVYVGKAANLKRRVSGYFRSRVERDPRVERILDSIVSLETQPAGSELEALLMEHRAIRDLSPAINLQSDVHARETTARAERRRVVVIVPSTRANCADLFLARGAEALRQARYSRRWQKRLPPLFEEFFFREDPSEGDAAEVAIFWTWFHQRADALRVVDPIAAGSAEETVRLVAEQAEDMLRGKERAFRV